MSQSHIIGRQIVELGLNSEQNAYAMQQEISWILQNQVMPRLEAMLDRMISPDIVIRMDQLELDLGYIDPDALERNFTETLLARFEKVLTERLEKVASASGFDEVKGVSNQVNILSAWKFYLEKGFLPWWISEKNWDSWEEKVIKALQKHRGSILAEIKSLKIPFAQVVQRLVWQFSEELLLQIIRSYLPTQLFTVGQLKKDLFHLVKAWKDSSISADTSELLFWEEIFRVLLRHPKAEDWQRMIVQSFLLKAAKELGISYKKLVQKSCDLSLSEEMPEDIGWSKSLENILIGLWKDISQDDAQILDAEVEKKTIEEWYNLSEGKEAQQAKIEEKVFDSQNLNEETALFVQNAGVVILHPFLPALFKELGYLHNGNFKNEESRHRAIYLIQYLARGEFENHEPDLSLNKLLCGLPLAMPIEKEIKLSETEKEEADHLLQTVVGHWKALKNTSPDGLRVNYFIREAKLSFTSTGWKLQIEHKTQDIMLGHLPWGIGAIKMPWMPDMLRVEWT